jgi:hypothetical protein
VAGIAKDAPRAGRKSTTPTATVEAIRWKTESNDLVVLEQIDGVGPPSQEVLVDLACGFELRPAVDLRHEHDFLAVTLCNALPIRSSLRPSW